MHAFKVFSLVIVCIYALFPRPVSHYPTPCYVNPLHALLPRVMLYEYPIPTTPCDTGHHAPVHAAGQHDRVQRLGRRGWAVRALRAMVDDGDKMIIAGGSIDRAGGGHPSKGSKRWRPSAALAQIGTRLSAASWFDLPPVYSLPFSLSPSVRRRVETACISQQREVC